MMFRVCGDFQIGFIVLVEYNSASLLIMATFERVFILVKFKNNSQVLALSMVLKRCIK